MCVRLLKRHTQIDISFQAHLDFAFFPLLWDRFSLSPFSNRWECDWQATNKTIKFILSLLIAFLCVCWCCCCCQWYSCVHILFSIIIIIFQAMVHSLICRICKCNLISMNELLHCEKGFKKQAHIQSYHRRRSLHGENKT